MHALQLRYYYGYTVCLSVTFVERKSITSDEKLQQQNGSVEPVCFKSMRNSLNTRRMLPWKIANAAR